MRLYSITVAQTIEEVFDDIEAESYQDACELAEERFRNEYGIDAWMGDYTHILHTEEDIDDDDD